jgi:hypothetical protein
MSRDSAPVVRGESGRLSAGATDASRTGKGCATGGVVSHRPTEGDVSPVPTHLLARMSPPGKVDVIRALPADSDLGQSRSGILACGQRHFRSRSVPGKGGRTVSKKKHSGTRSPAAQHVAFAFKLKPGKKGPPMMEPSPSQAAWASLASYARVPNTRSRGYPASAEGPCKPRAIHEVRSNSIRGRIRRKRLHDHDRQVAAGAT